MMPTKVTKGQLASFLSNNSHDACVHGHFDGCLSWNLRKSSLTVKRWFLVKHHLILVGSRSCDPYPCDKIDKAMSLIPSAPWTEAHGSWRGGVWRGLRRWCAYTRKHTKTRYTHMNAGAHAHKYVNVCNIMTPCRTEKVDFSKKLKTQKKNKNKNKNKITKKTNRQEESPEETKKTRKKQKKKNQKKSKPAFSAVLIFFVFCLFFFVFSCFFLGFGFLVCFFCLLWFFIFIFYFFYFFCQTLYSLCCWTHKCNIHI